MFAAGVPLVESLDAVAGAAGNAVYTAATKRIQTEVSTGTSLTNAMTNTRLFPSMVLQMTQIGEESGSLDNMLGKIAEFYEREVDDAVAALSSLLEPIIIVFLGVVIGGLVVAMYLPIFKLGAGRLTRRREATAASRGSTPPGAAPAGGRARRAHAESRHRPAHHARRARVDARIRCSPSSPHCVVGLCVGSFLNVVIHRLPKMLERGWRAQCAELRGEEHRRRARLQPRRAALGVPRVRPPDHRARERPGRRRGSSCGGKCSACKAPISARYPIVEIAGGLLAVAAIVRFGATAQGAAACVLLWTLLALTLIDFDTQLLPDDLTLPLAVGGADRQPRAGVFAPLASAVIGAVAGYLTLWSSTGCSS